MNLIKGQIFKSLTFDIIIGGHSKSKINVEGNEHEREFMNMNENEQEKGVQAYLYIHSVKKIA